MMEKAVSMGGPEALTPALSSETRMLSHKLQIQDHSSHFPMSPCPHPCLAYSSICAEETRDAWRPALLCAEHGVSRSKGSETDCVAAHPHYGTQGLRQEDLLPRQRPGGGEMRAKPRG